MQPETAAWHGGERFSVCGDLLLGGELVSAAAIIANGRIEEIVRSPHAPLPQPIIEAAVVAPGFIDLQVNGGFGVAVGDDPDAIRTLARRLPETGVTAFLPTVITAPAASYGRAVAAFEEARATYGALPLGLHLEGPFLSTERAGAHRRDLIASADPHLIDELLAYEPVRLVTFAPERPGVPGWIRRFRERGVVVSLGHSNASADEFLRGVDAGATMVTHLYNAMSPFEHRSPNVIGATLTDDRVTAGLIPDGVHSHRSSMELAVRAKGWDRIALVTDMVAAAGMPPGSYVLGGETVLSDGSAVRREDGTLAGSALLMDAAVRNMTRWTSAGIPAVLRMAAEVPARVLGLSRKGVLAAGYDADLVLLDRGLCLQATLAGGKLVYRKEAS